MRRGAHQPAQVRTTQLTATELLCRPSWLLEYVTCSPFSFPARSYAARGSPLGPYCDILRMLLEAGADQHATDAIGRSAYDVARLAVSVNPQQQPALQILLEAAFSPSSGSSG